MDVDTHIVVNETGTAEVDGSNRTHPKMVFRTVGSSALPEMRLSHNMDGRMSAPNNKSTSPGM